MHKVDISCFIKVQTLINLVFYQSLHSLEEYEKCNLDKMYWGDIYSSNRTAQDFKSDVERARALQLKKQGKLLLI